MLKELADNGLDTGAEVKRRRSSPSGGYFVEDDGPGIDGTPEDIARLFCINRPMVSTKLLRLPTRGALGNGLRVVAGAVLASGGTLVVITRNRASSFAPSATAPPRSSASRRSSSRSAPASRSSFGPALPCDEARSYWAKVACRVGADRDELLGQVSPLVVRRRAISRTALRQRRRRRCAS